MNSNQLNEFILFTGTIGLAWIHSSFFLGIYVGIIIIHILFITEEENKL